MRAVPVNVPRTAKTGLSDETAGMLLGLVGVAIFGLTFPATRLAVADLPPEFVALGRAVGAALLALAWLLWKRLPFPPRSALLPLALVSAGCIIGFPWLTSIALQTLPASHGAVLVGILPLATAAFSAWRGNERPSPSFWVMALAGSALVIGFALHQSGGSFHRADLLMLAAVALAAVGYTEGARLSKTMGGPQVISWALVLSAPLLAPLLVALSWQHAGVIAAAGVEAWLGFGYVAAFSMYIGFFFWYGGMARGGIARVGQVQLVQPFVTLAGAWLILGEPLARSNFLFAAAVIAVVAAGRQMQVKPARQVAETRIDVAIPMGMPGRATYNTGLSTHKYEKSMSFYEKLKALDITLKAPAAPVAAYVMYVQTGNLVFLSGHLARTADGAVVVGQLGKDVTVEQGQKATRQIAIDLIGTLQEACGGDLNRVTRIVKLTSLVNSTPDFTDHHLVTNGASSLLGDVFGDAGKHARAAFGVAQIPLGACAEIDMVVEIA